MFSPFVHLQGMCMDGSEVLDLPDDRGSCKAISKPAQIVLSGNKLKLRILVMLKDWM